MSVMSNEILPFKLAVSDFDLENLRNRLRQTRWPDRETCLGWDQGLPLEYAKELVQYWINQYDWRRIESILNGWTQCTTEINGVDIHFIHERSTHGNARPLIMSHGWPGSIVEFHKVIDPLVNPTAHGGSAEDAFHVVVPSLPGYGFSGKPETVGTSVEVIGRMWGELMARLGYENYFAQGGDWGSIITHSMGLTETEHCAGIHVNLPIVPVDPETLDQLTTQERSAVDAWKYYKQWDSGYAKQQSTRPQTLAYGLADSPVGQMAWIVEKFYAWVDCEVDGVKHVENVLTKDELLDNVMVYWLNNCAASSARLYWESFAKSSLEIISIPAGCSVFPQEIFRCSRRWAEKRFAKLIHFGELKKGGHFAAIEQPETFVREVRECFRHLR